MRFCPEHQLALQPQTCGDCRKALGLDAVEEHNEDWLSWIRGWALALHASKGRVNTSELREIADRHGRQPEHQNAWGAVFRTKEWQAVGLVKNTKPSAHARRVFEWKLKTKGQTDDDDN